MKQLLPMITLLVFAFTVTSHAVLEDSVFTGKKGNLWLGGCIGIKSVHYSFENESVDDFSVNYFSIQPTIRFFLTDRFVLGPKIQFDRLSERYKGNSDGISSIGLGGDLGFLISTEKIKPYFITAPQLTLTSQNDNVEPSFTIPITGGVMIPFASRIGFQVETGVEIKHDDNLSKSSFLLGIGFCGLGRKSAISTMTSLGGIF